MENGGGGAPTGCYKCGRPGHWSRDCPSNPSSNPDDSNPKTTSSYPIKPSAASKAGEKPKKVPRTRPKLTNDLLLSNDGIGYVLRHFPPAFKLHGRGHEVEEVGSSKRVKLCLQNLREKVASGEDPTKLDDPAVQHDISNNEQEATNLDEQEPNLFPEETTTHINEFDEVPEEMLHDIYNTATEETPRPLQEETIVGNNNVTSQAVTDSNKNNGESQISEEQKARIEANRRKALERAAARARDSQTATTQ